MGEERGRKGRIDEADISEDRRSNSKKQFRDARCNMAIGLLRMKWGTMEEKVPADVEKLLDLL